MPQVKPLVTLLRAFFAGDRSSLELIATRCEIDILRMIQAALRRRRMQNPREQHDLQEITQSVYLALLRFDRTRNERPITNEVGYLNGLIDNAIRQRSRRSNAQCRREQRLRPYDPHSPPLIAAPPRQVEYVERLDLLRAALKQLTPHERRLVVWRAHGWSFVQIARRSRISVRVCRATHRRIIQRLRESPCEDFGAAPKRTPTTRPSRKPKR